MRIRCVCCCWGSRGGYQSSYRCVGPPPPNHTCHLPPIPIPIPILIHIHIHIHIHTHTHVLAGSHVQRMPLYIGSFHSLAREVCSIFTLVLARSLCSLCTPVHRVPCPALRRTQGGGSWPHMRLAFCLAHIATAAAATTSGCCSSSGNSNRNVALCFNRFIWRNCRLDWHSGHCALDFLHLSEWSKINFNQYF